MSQKTTSTLLAAAIALTSAVAVSAPAQAADFWTTQSAAQATAEGEIVDANFRKKVFFGKGFKKKKFKSKVFFGPRHKFKKKKFFFKY